MTSHKSGRRGGNFATHCRCAVNACATLCPELCSENCAQNCMEEVPADVTRLPSFQQKEAVKDIIVFIVLRQPQKNPEDLMFNAKTILPKIRVRFW